MIQEPQRPPVSPVVATRRLPPFEQLKPRESRVISPVQEEKRIKYIRRCVSKNAAIYPFIRDIKDIRIFGPRNALYLNML